MDDAFTSEPDTAVDRPLLSDEEITAVVPYQTLAECAAAWRAQLAQSEAAREPDDARTCRLPIVSRCAL